MTNLSDLTDEQLRAELKRRDDEKAARIAAEREARIQKMEFYLSFPEARNLLRFLLPEHSRTTCGAEDSCSNVYRCTRCTINEKLATGDYAYIVDHLKLETW